MVCIKRNIESNSKNTKGINFSKVSSSNILSLNTILQTITTINKNADTIVKVKGSLIIVFISSV